MSNEVVESRSHALDGFDDASDDAEGRAQQGSLVKFTNDIEWIANDEVLPPTLELVAVNVDRYVVYWKPDGTGPDREKSFYLTVGQKCPDIDQMNADTPKDQWREAFGKLQGPWQFQHVVRLLHPVSMYRYSFPTSTNGGHAAVAELKQRTKDMRQVRGERVYPLVRLRDTFMSTAYGGRQRPHFEIVKFVTLGDDGTVTSSILPSTSTPSIAGSTNPSTPTPASSSGAQMRTVEPLTIKEVVQDEILY
jgi:hypothetical protein